MSRQKPLKKTIRNVALLRWELVAIIAVMGLILGIASIPEWGISPKSASFFVYGSLLLLVGFILYISIFRWRTLEARLSVTEADLSRSQQRLASVFRLGQEFSRTDDESEALRMGLEMCLEISEATSLCYLPFDGRGHPQSLIWLGDIIPSELKSWAEQQSYPSIRSNCLQCASDQPGLHEHCALSAAYPPEIRAVHCLPVRRKDHEIGILNVFLREGETLDPEANAILIATLSEMAVVIDAIRLRRKEAEAEQLLHDSQQADQRSVIQGLIEHMYQASEADFLVLSATTQASLDSGSRYSFGDVPPSIEPRISALLVDSMAGREISLGSDDSAIQTDFPGYVRIIGSPIVLPDGEVAGSLVAGWDLDHGPRAWDGSQMRSAANGIGLVLAYSGMTRELEFRAVMSERNRLAREIHDGLAQSVGYLKLLAARMRGYLEEGDFDRLDDALHASRQVLDETYQDARRSIDGLKLSPVTGLSGWLEQMAYEFQDMTKIRVILAGEMLESEPMPEVQAQLMRIVQEALTNIRKHAGADQVWIEWFLDRDNLVLQVRDNGIGIGTPHLPNGSGYGLINMRERAELIGADLGITSTNTEGTIVRLAFPLKVPSYPE